MEGTYSGRLAWDPDANMHVDGDGNPVVTEDGGLTWRYATDGDESHYERYHERHAVVDGTANELATLALEHGREKAEQIMRDRSPHHFDVTPDDEHFEEGATLDGKVTNTRLKSVPDHRAATLTGHTEAWKEG